MFMNLLLLLICFSLLRINVHFFYINRSKLLNCHRVTIIENSFIQKNTFSYLNYSVNAPDECTRHSSCSMNASIIIKKVT